MTAATLNPISSIPDELLLEVLTTFVYSHYPPVNELLPSLGMYLAGSAALVMETAFDWKQVPDVLHPSNPLTVITQVSRHWRSLAQSKPTLWELVILDGSLEKEPFMWSGDPNVDLEKVGALETPKLARAMSQLQRRLRQAQPSILVVAVRFGTEVHPSVQRLLFNTVATSSQYWVLFAWSNPLDPYNRYLMDTLFSRSPPLDLEQLAVLWYLASTEGSVRAEPVVNAESEGTASSPLTKTATPNLKSVILTPFFSAPRSLPWHELRAMEILYLSRSEMEYVLSKATSVIAIAIVTFDPDARLPLLTGNFPVLETLILAPSAKERIYTMPLLRKAGHLLTESTYERIHFCDLFVPKLCELRTDMSSVTAPSITDSILRSKCEITTLECTFTTHDVASVDNGRGVLRSLLLAMPALKTLNVFGSWRMRGNQRDSRDQCRVWYDVLAEVSDRDDPGISLAVSACLSPSQPHFHCGPSNAPFPP